MDPVAWWENFGFETPSLQTLAIKVLSQVSSVAMFEEIWQANDFPCREAAGRLGVQKMEDLFFIRNNLRLHGRINGNLCFSFAQRNAFSSSSSGVETWEGLHLDQSNAMENRFLLESRVERKIRKGECNHLDVLEPVWKWSQLHSWQHSQTKPCW
ncbi:hypothetical protein NC653_023794 [Populus alba x Populus x berolinensis]|uniref:HAT C-terminal dimerisation domain-containing protein n=1 Tax=Populus alba x Populus x berolinensis TaxID=444605 RepID=A0AAD6MI29_9ROSI|nr:hypothetical protein NC653_023794 [Populus alba x Populus x berolinensis]